MALNKKNHRQNGDVHFRHPTLTISYQYSPKNFPQQINHILGSFGVCKKGETLRFIFYGDGRSLRKNLSIRLIN